MKKLKVFLVLVSIFSILVLPVRLLKAEEIENDPVEEEIVEVDENLTEDKLIEIIKDKLGAFSENNYILEIIAWLRDAGVITALLGVVVKYNRYKNKTIGELTNEVYDKAKNVVNERLKENSEELAKVKEAMQKLADANETMMKVLTLMQDNSAKGKIAVLDYLTSHSEDGIPEAKAIKEEIVAEETKKEEIVAEVNKPYESIF